MVSEERAEAHQAFDYTSFVGLVAQRLSPPPEVPWLHPPTAASQAVRLAVLAGSLPIMGLTFAAEQAVAPLVRRWAVSKSTSACHHHSNLYKRHRWQDTLALYPATQFNIPFSAEQ